MSKFWDEKSESEDEDEGLLCACCVRDDAVLHVGGHGTVAGVAHWRETSMAARGRMCRRK